MERGVPKVRKKTRETDLVEVSGGNVRNGEREIFGSVREVFLIPACSDACFKTVDKLFRTRESRYRKKKRTEDRVGLRNRPGAGRGVDGAGIYLIGRARKNRVEFRRVENPLSLVFRFDVKSAFNMF